ncbi:unnamed protein product [Diamesa hyperborea]
MKLFLTLVLVFIATVNAEQEENAIPTAGIHLKSLIALRDSLKDAKFLETPVNADGATAGIKLSSLMAARFDQATIDAITKYAAAKANLIASKEDKISALKSVLAEDLKIEGFEDREARRNKRMQEIMSKLPEKYQLPADFKFPENFVRKSTDNIAE